MLGAINGDMLGALKGLNALGAPLAIIWRALSDCSSF